MIKVSVIIPMYNEECYIWRCLGSLKEQTFKDFEVILIDDGSKDDTIKIAESFKNDFQLTILEQKHRWPWKARNRWAKEAKWEILIFVDADMYFDKNYIKYLIQPILDRKELWTAHWSEIVWNIEDILAKTWSINRIPIKSDRSSAYRAIEKKEFFNSWWYNDDKYAFEDNIGSKNGVSALVVNEAICYHNNPTNLKEVFNHDARIWESLVAKKMYKDKNLIKEYHLSKKWNKLYSIFPYFVYY